MTGINWRLISEPEFTRIVDTLLGRKYGARGHAPEGRGGDSGIDFTVDNNKIIFQYKFYPDGSNTASRRRQIRRSFEAARKHNPKEWIVIIPAKLTEKFRTYILGLSMEIKVVIHDVVWLDNELIDDPPLAENFQYRSDMDYLAAKAEQLKINPLLRTSAEIANTVRNVQYAIEASDPDWTFDISTVNGQVTQTLRAKDANSQVRSPIEITYTAAIPEDSPERRQLELSLDYGVIEPVTLSGIMVKDFKITGPELVAYEGPVEALELLPDPDGASPWVITDLEVMDADANVLGTHLGRSRLRSRGSKGVTIEVQISELLRMLFRAPDKMDQNGSGDFATEDFSQHPISEVLSVSEFLTQMRRGSVVRVKVEGFLLMEMGLSGVVAADWPEHFRQVRDLADDLAVIERETNTRFRYPGTLTGLDRVTVRNTRLMLEGHVVAHPTDTQFGATLTGVWNSTLDVLLGRKHGWMKWEGEDAQLKVLDKMVSVPKLAMGGPTRLSKQTVADVRKALKRGKTDGLRLTFQLDDPEDRLRIWMPDRFKGEKLWITPWNLPGIQQPTGTLSAIAGNPDPIGSP